MIVVVKGGPLTVFVPWLLVTVVVPLHTVVVYLVVVCFGTFK